MNIPDRSETYKKEESLPLQQGTLPEVGTFGTNNYNVEYMPRLNDRSSPYCNTMTIQTGFSARGMYTNSSIERKTIKSAHWTDNGQGTNFQHVQPNMSQVVSETYMDPHAVPFEPQASCAAPSIGQDLWRQLKRVQIPVFTGDKRTYQSWKAAFLACIDSTLEQVNTSNCNSVNTSQEKRSK